MWLSDVSVKRPVFATVISLVLVAFGVLSFRDLTVREQPDVVPPVVQVPAAPPVLSAPQGVLFEAVVSRDDHIAPKSLLTIDGIVLKIKDTDWDPLDVDIELSILGNSLDFDDIPLGSTVEVYGQSGQLYRVHILAIDDDSETLRFAISQ